MRSASVKLGIVALGLATLLMGQAVTGAPPPADQIEALIIANFEQDQRAIFDFTHIEHVVSVKDGHTEGHTLRVWYVHGRPVSETIARDDRAMGKDELKAEHVAALKKAREAAQREPPPTGVIEFSGHSYPFSRLAHDYVYGNPSTQQWQGRTVWIYQATPNPAVNSRSREETLLLHSTGEVWVDAEDRHAVRILIHTTKPVHYGLGVLATVHRANMELTLERQAPGVWLPDKLAFSLDATILLFDSIHRAKTQTFSDYALAVPGAPKQLPFSR